MCCVRGSANRQANSQLLIQPWVEADSAMEAVGKRVIRSIDTFLLRKTFFTP